MENNFDTLAHDFATVLAHEIEKERLRNETFIKYGPCRDYIANTGLSSLLHQEDYGHLTFDYHYQYLPECGNDRCARPDCGLTETGTITVYGNGAEYTYSY